MLRGDTKSSSSGCPSIRHLVLINPAVDVSEHLWQRLSPAERQTALAQGFVRLHSSYLDPEDDAVGLTFFEQVKAFATTGPHELQHRVLLASAACDAVAITAALSCLWC